MQITDRMTLGDARVNDVGYLEVNARTARVGVQQYLGSDVGRPELPIVNVYRDESEVFSKTSLDTFAGIPITVDHPQSGVVDAESWKKDAVGTSLNEVLRDGEFLKIGLKIMDAAAVKAVQGGKRELSVGYSTELVWQDGIAPDGTPYQARQTAIKANHIAIVAKGRAGSQVRIGDGADKWGAAPIPPTTDKEAITMSDALRTVVVDGLSVQTTDQGAQAIAVLQQRIADAATKATETATAHAAAIEAKDTEIGTLKADLKKAQDAAIKPADLDKMVADRAALVATVKAVDSKIVVDGKSDADLRKAAVTAKLGDEMVKDASDAEIAGMFKAIAKDVKPTDAFADALKGGVKVVGDAATQANDAFAQSVTDLNAWRKEA